MVLDLLSLMGAYATGSCRDKPMTIYAGGFRGDGGRAGDLALQGGRLLVFFYCNTTAFVASLLIIVLLLGRRVQRYYAMEQLCGFILVALFGLLGAYAAGSSRALDTTAYVIALAGAVTAYIFLVMLVKLLASDPHKNSNAGQRASDQLQLGGCQSGNQHNHQNQSNGHSRLAPPLLASAMGATMGGSWGMLKQLLSGMGRRPLTRLILAGMRVLQLPITYYLE